MKKEDELNSLTPQAKNHRVLVDKIYSKYSHFTPPQSALIPILQEVQAEAGYLPGDALIRVSELLKVSPSQVYGVATFYHQFRLRPKGAHMITICRGTACHVRGSLDLYNFINQQLGIKPPQDTSSDGVYTVQQVRCLGACGLAPVIKVDETVFGKVNHVKIKSVLRAVKNGGKN
jgi:NADH:ubiquinone oxidoreductase subunit E